MKKILAIAIVSVFLLAGCGSQTNRQRWTDIEKDITPGCAVWFDGCNKCFVEHGKIGHCTLRDCPGDPADQKEPTCLVDMEEL
ncbi:MAG: hypothetical protein K9M51_00760 [Candidatus Gracilibacteria bacterium]|nr:hypothetical protein [Candidatus Gracilibacteria bacterium]